MNFKTRPLFKIGYSLLWKKKKEADDSESIVLYISVIKRISEKVLNIETMLQMNLKIISFGEVMRIAHSYSH